MWTLLPSKVRVTLTVALAAVLLLAASAAWASLTGQPTTPLKWISLITMIIGSMLAGLANVFWFKIAKLFPVLQTKLFPDLNGTWKGFLHSTWVNPETGQGVPPIDATFVIKQGLFKTHVTMATNESKSESTRAILEAFPDVGRYRLWYSYNNDPKAQVLHRSSPHEGVAFLELEWNDDRHRLQGRYYTARKTTGDIDVRREAHS